MANPFETSFIPQQPLLKVEGVSRRKDAVNFSAVFSVVIFLAAAVVAGALYFYRANVIERIIGAQTALAAAEQYFSIDEINKYKHADTRLRAAKNLVHQHTINSVILDFLEKNTAVNVGLTSFGAMKDDGGYRVSLVGQAPSYSAAYFQVEKWRSMQPTIKELTVGNMGLSEETGIVTFAVTLNIDPTYLQLSTVLEREGNLHGIIPPKAATQSNSPTP